MYTLAQPDFHYIRTFQGSTLAQPDFHYIRTFQGSTLAQPEIFIFMVNDIFQATLAHPNFYYIRKFLLCMYVLLHMHILYLYLCLNQVVAVLKAKKKLAVTLFYYISRKIWLGNSKKLICRDQSIFCICSPLREFKNV